MSEVFHSIYISYTNEHQKRKKLSLRNSNQNCWGTEKTCSKRFALDTSQSFLTCKGVRGLFCLRYVKESGRVNTTVWVSSEVWSGLLRAEGILGSHISREVALSSCEDAVWFPQQGKKEKQAHHPPQYYCKHSTLNISDSQNIFQNAKQGCPSFPFHLANSRGNSKTDLKKLEKPHYKLIFYQYKTL